jgi:glutaconate CoA-transferase, subunit B
MTADASPSAREFLIGAAARRIATAGVCFAGIGLPSTAAILALRAHNPDLFLVFESGALGSRPARCPLTVADQALVTTASAVVSVPEIFNYWIQPGRIPLAVIGAGQVDRLGNVNSTAIGGTYGHPRVRLPGAGGAPEVATGCKRTMVVALHSRRTFVPAVDFVTTAGSVIAGRSRPEVGLDSLGPSIVVTDLAVLESEASGGELVVTGLQPAATIKEVQAATAWELKVAAHVERLAPPSEDELATLRALEAAPSHAQV